MRKAKPKKRILLPDPKFHDVEVTEEEYRVFDLL